MNTYLFIFEDASIKIGNKFSDEDKESCDDGILEVICIDDTANPMSWYDGKWNTLERI